jgi:nucleotide-binding universal stress UspA family protein
MKTLIVATDFSAPAENAVDYAAAIAKHYQARLVLFNAFAVPVPAANGQLSVADFDGLLLDNQNRLKKRAEQVAESYSIRVNYESSYSIIPEELENLLAKYPADLVVMGMEPNSLTQDLLGNTTTAVIRGLHWPVLAVPEGARFEGLKKILFACDMLHSLPPDILPKIKSMAIALKAEVEVFFVAEKTGLPGAARAGSGDSEVIVAALEGIAYSYKEIRSDAVITEIRQEILAAEADLLVMVPKEYGFWSSVVHRSKTRAMASGLTIPLLAMPV